MALLIMNMEEAAYHEGTRCTVAVLLQSIRQVSEQPTAIIQIKAGNAGGAS
jgi:hypothetical protein